MCRARHGASCPGVMALTSASATRTVPLVGLSSPAMRLSNVDFPEPDGPINARKLPSCTLRVMPVKTSMRCVSRWKDLWTSRISTRAMMPPQRGLRFAHRHAHAGARRLDTAHQQQLATRKTAANLTKATARGTRLDHPRLEASATHQPHDRTAAVLAHRGHWHADARRARAGRRARTSALGLEKIHPRAHLR